MTKIYEKLTADWKAGKLEYGWYWIKHKTRGTIPDQYIPGDDWFVSNGFCITKILAPCNYDEYKAMQKELAEHQRYCCCSENEVMRLKLAEMEELLKECKEWFECFAWNKEYKHKSVNILARINAAIDESEKR